MFLDFFFRYSKKLPCRCLNANLKCSSLGLVAEHRYTLQRDIYWTLLLLSSIAQAALGLRNWFKQNI